MNKTASGILTAGLGGLLVWSGVSNAGVFESLRALVSGHAPTPGVPQASILSSIPLLSGAALQTGGNPAASGASGNGTATGQQIAALALGGVGVPYWWGGRDRPPAGKGWDCYGMLTNVLHDQAGYNLPNNTHSGFLEFMAWSGAYQVPNDQVAAGDLIIWPSHSGIAISGTEMVSAENPKAGTRVDTFEAGGPTLPEPRFTLRVKGTSGMQVA